MLPNEPEVIDGRLPFPDAQVALDGVGEGVDPTPYTCSWYGTEVSDERGSFGLVDDDGPLGHLIGDRVRVRYRRSGTGVERYVVVYVFGATELDTDIAITRRAFAAIELLALEEISVQVEVVSQ